MDWFISSATLASTLKKCSPLLQSILALWTLLGTYSSAFGCAVCGFGIDDPSRIPFLITTILLTLLPLIMGGAIVFGIYFLNKKNMD